MFHSKNFTSSHIQETYINMVSYRLPKCKQKSSNLWNFRCVECGDSKKDQTKMRGFIHWYSKENEYFYTCKNCGYSNSFSNWLKGFDFNLHKQMIIDSLKDNGTWREKKESIVDKKIQPNVPDFKKSVDIQAENSDNNLSKQSEQSINKPNFMALKPKVVENTDKVSYDDLLSDDYIEFDGFNRNIFDGIPSIADLPDNHGAKKYVIDRQIPEKYHNNLFFVWRFMTWINTWKPNKFSDGALFHDEPRLVIPFYSPEGKVFAVQGRSFKKVAKDGETILRYVTIKKNDDDPKIYGLESIDKDHIVKVLEGPIDSMFVDNSIAMAGADVSTIETYTGDNLVMVYDNEPRSKEIYRRLLRDIEIGKRVLIWPSFIMQKDVNDMITKGNFSITDINTIINDNIYKGMTAKMKLAEWTKINGDKQIKRQFHKKQRR